MSGKTNPKKASARKASAKQQPSPVPPAGGQQMKEPEATGEVKRPAKAMAPERREALYRMLMAKRRELVQEISENLGASLTEDQRRDLESVMDVGDQSLQDLDRELGISLMEIRNKRRQLIDEALTRLEEGTYGFCEDCGIEISEKRLAVVPFAKLCVACQSKQELIEKIERAEEREE
jgi:DnaK suppressor protein